MIQIFQLENNKAPYKQSNIKKALVINEHEPDYWTQYNLTHNFLGAKRGPGLAKEISDRPSYNIFTGH